MSAGRKPTHEELRISALAFARNREYDYRHHERKGLALSVVASEAVTAAGDIPDVIGWANGVSSMIECKASRSDFFADAKKPQRCCGTGMGNYRYFFAPQGLLGAEEIPGGWGLIEIDGKEKQITVKAPRRELDVAGHEAEKRVLLSLLRRIKMREFLIIQAEAE